MTDGNARCCCVKGAGASVEREAWPGARPCLTMALPHSLSLLPSPSLSPSCLRVHAIHLFRDTWRFVGGRIALTTFCATLLLTAHLCAGTFCRHLLLLMQTLNFGAALSALPLQNIPFSGTPAACGIILHAAFRQAWRHFACCGPAHRITSPAGALLLFATRGPVGAACWQTSRDGTHLRRLRISAARLSAWHIALPISLLARRRTRSLYWRTLERQHI